MFLLFLIFGCRQKENPETERTFYYWKSFFQLSHTETTALENLKITKLYVKFFDVEPAADGQSPWPVAQLKADSTSLFEIQKQNIKIIPVVFITNETLKNLDSSGLNILAENMFRLLTGISKNLLLTQYSEFQIDCDWTERTKSQYFYLLQKIKHQMNTSELFDAKKILSATIRLHQVKYSSKTGVPPVDKGLLMCYNMGNLKNPSTNNSILDPAEMKSYLVGLDKYPLKLDIALPLFEWQVSFSNRHYNGISSKIKSNQLNSTSGKWKGNRFTFERDTVLGNIPFTKGDMLRFEESSKANLEKSIDFLKQKIISEHFSIVFYHLDELILNKHPQHELEALYQRFYH